MVAVASEAGGQVVQGVKRRGVVVAVHAAPQLEGLEDSTWYGHGDTLEHHVPSMHVGLWQHVS
jgi:hypothetical protein